MEGSASASAPASPAASIVAKASQPVTATPNGTAPKPSSPVPVPANGSAPAAVDGANPSPPVDQGGEFADRFASLARKEARHVQEVQKFKAERQEFDQYRALKEKAKNDPVSVLEHFGLSYEGLTQTYLDKDKVLTPEEKIAALEKRLDDDKSAAQKAQEEAERAEEQGHIDAHKARISDFVKADPVKYELINHEGKAGQDMIWEVTEEWYNTHNGEIIPIDKASDLVEQWLEDRLSGIKGLKRFGAPDVKPNGTSKPTNNQSTTLTNVQTAASPDGAADDLSDEALKRRASSLIRWTN